MQAQLILADRAENRHADCGEMSGAGLWLGVLRVGIVKGRCGRWDGRGRDAVGHRRCWAYGMRGLLRSEASDVGARVSDG